MAKLRVGYPSDVTEEEEWFVLPYLLLCREDSGQREYDPRDVFNAVRYMARSGCSWRLIPNDLPPWAAVYQQFRRSLDAGVFQMLVVDVHSIVREWTGRKGQPSAVCIDRTTLRSIPGSGARAGYDGDKRRNTCGAFGPVCRSIDGAARAAAPSVRTQCRVLEVSVSGYH